MRENFRAQDPYEHLKLTNLIVLRIVDTNKLKSLKIVKSIHEYGWWMMAWIVVRIVVRIVLRMVNQSAYGPTTQIFSPDSDLTTSIVSPSIH